jgi:DNA modification methylase
MSKHEENEVTKGTGGIPFWRTTASNGRRERVGKFGLDLGERGTYDTRNSLNELTGKEWTYFLNSVWIKAYPPVADRCGFDLRKIHPCPKPPLLMRDIILFFTKGDQWILDPFAGVGGTLLGASLCKPSRNSVGIDLNEAYVAAYRSVSEAEGLSVQRMLCADANEMLSYDDVKEREFDLILTDPPYSNLMNRPKNGHKKKLYGRNDATPFTDSDNDIGNLPYDIYFSKLRDILTKAASQLKIKKYMVVFCRDLQPTSEYPYLLHADMIDTIRQIPGMVYRGMRIWHDQAIDLYPFGYPYAFVMNQMHQYILIFRKEANRG